VFPPGYLASVYDLVRRAGCVCIADEVQTAYGRMGTSFFAFEDQRVVRTSSCSASHRERLSAGAVVTTEAIAASFDNGMEFFSTFGGSTVSAAVGLAVLDVVEAEHRQAHALGVGDRLLKSLGEIQLRHALVGDVRGSGLYLGVELVTEQQALTPATKHADYVVNRMREEGILIGSDGPFHNVLKIRPRCRSTSATPIGCAKRSTGARRVAGIAAGAMNTAARIACIVVLAITYFIAGRLGLGLAFLNASASAVWPPTGIALASVLVMGRWLWPGSRWAPLR